MAGTLPNLPLSTQFDKDSGRPLKGGKLVFYVANAPSSPLVVFKDTGLTLPWGDRLTLDGAGRVPMFYLPDGNVGIRLTSRTGVIQVEEPNLLVIGPSAGGGGGGGGVDATTIFKTGDVMVLDQTGARAGWVRDNGRTIGSGSSGATERANADCQALFLFLWTSYADTFCPVLGGRGANAAADWAADKQITLPDKRGRLPCGLDDMGNASANRLNGVTFALGNATTAGSAGGAATHTLALSEMPVHGHSVSLTDPGHKHNVGLQPNAPGGGGGGWITAAPNVNAETTTVTTGITLSQSNAGGGAAHNNMPPFFTGTWYRKL